MLLFPSPHWNAEVSAKQSPSEKKGKVLMAKTLKCYTQRGDSRCEGAVTAPDKVITWTLHVRSGAQGIERERESRNVKCGSAAQRRPRPAPSASKQTGSTWFTLGCIRYMEGYYAKRHFTFLQNPSQLLRNFWKHWIIPKDYICKNIIYMF